MRSETRTRDTIATGIGVSVADDAVTAGRRATSLALAEIGDAPPALLVVLASPNHDLPDLLAGIALESNGTPLVGATTCGQFSDGTFVPPGAGVTVVALTAGPYRFGVASTDGVRADEQTAEDAGRRLAEQARAAVGAPTRAFGAILLLAVGVGGHLEALLRGIHRVAGARVPVVGGAASDDRLMTETFVFHDGRLLPDGAVAVWVDSPHPVAVSARHGWTSVSQPMIVTRTEGTLVHELGGRPAGEVYLAATGPRRPQPADGAWAAGARPRETGVVDDTYGWNTSHALGLIRPDGGHLIRACYFDDDGRLRTFAPLPEYSAVEVVSSTPDDMLAVTESVVQDVLQDSSAGLLLAFSCVARLDALTGRSQEEVHRLQAAAGAVRTCGFYTYGEFARTVGAGGFHNATVAAVAL